ncbi:hypothetical protein BUALT_Bualt02G0081200 [Buddleja alternifolia]|uniref:Uncharacterized protein n=1 Tax=Buddleja alternifolia TaxID=168488 RepID=A0AAV6XZT8_9LAMI|nr:hypothetical protein BUALT_Bualt02G0081200 [Buddleja alternifolia]
MGWSVEDFSDSDSDSDDGFKQDMDALKRACQLTGIDNQRQLRSADNLIASVSASSETESDEDDLQLVRSIQDRFAGSMGIDEEEEPLTMKPLCMLPPDWSDSDDCNDDYETLRAIHRRFSAYSDGGFKDNKEDFLHRPLQVGATTIDSGKETSNSFIERTNAREGFLNCVDTSEPTGQKSEACNDAGRRQPSDLVEWDELGADDVAGLPLKGSHFPKSALAFVDAIKKNRSCQKLIRSKMMQMEARIEELKKMMDRVKILKDFHVACKKRTGRALSQKKDARVHLISVPRLRANTKFNDKKIPAVYKGPPENPHVSNYKEALATFPVSVCRQKWSKEEKENLMKGVKQQFQGMLLQRSVDHLGDPDGSFDSINVDSIIVSIKDVDITPEKIRLFLPKVNWEQLAAMYVPGRSGAECQARFLNWEDPLINHDPWTPMEDKNLLHIVQQKGLNNWIDIAASLGTNRTPFQCLARYQRSLNASILKREWTKEEDNQLRAAVETFGESNWQLVASAMEGRTGTQCSNRWLKTLHPGRKRIGKWTEEEDKRMKVAVTLFGPKTWKKVARCVPGRTQVQCRERWVNCLDPSLNTAEWTQVEDSKLEAAIAEHGYCWSKVAACVPRRTDNQCWRRWKVLFPNEVPLLQAARKIQKAALISNFVDREAERPALGPKDFRLAEPFRITGPENVDASTSKRRSSRRRNSHKHIEKDASSSESYQEEVPRLRNGRKGENMQCKSITRKGRGKSSRSMKKNAGPSYSHLSPPPDSAMSNSEEIKKSYKRSRRLQKKRSRVKSESVEVAETLVSEVDTQVILKMKKETKKEKKTSDQLSSFPDSMSLMEAVHGIKARKRKRNTQETCLTSDSVPLSVDDLNQMQTETADGDGSVNLLRDKPYSSHVEIAPSAHFRSNTETAVSSGMDKELQHIRENAIALSETEDGNTTLASFLQSKADRPYFPSPKVGKLLRKEKKISHVESSSIGDLSDPSCSQMVVYEAGSKSNEEVCQNQALDSDDDTTLAHLYNKLKKRRS